VISDSNQRAVVYSISLSSYLIVNEVSCIYYLKAIRAGSFVIHLSYHAVDTMVKYIYKDLQATIAIVF